jgi:hypothetical protein
VQEKQESVDPVSSITTLLWSILEAWPRAQEAATAVHDLEGVAATIREVVVGEGVVHHGGRTLAMTVVVAHPEGVIHGIGAEAHLAEVIPVIIAEAEVTAVEVILEEGGKCHYTIQFGGGGIRGRCLA